MNWAYLYTFVQTNLLEWPFYAWALGITQGRWLGTTASVLALNAFTHPLVFFLIMSRHAPLLENIVLAECFAFGFEIWACVFFLGLSWRRALLGAGLGNLASWQFGPRLTYLFFF